MMSDFGGSRGSDGMGLVVVFWVTVLGGRFGLRFWVI